MLFKNEAQRQQHPQAKIIPNRTKAILSIWNDDLSHFYDFPDELINLIAFIQNTPHLLLSYLSNNSTVLQQKQFKKKAIYIIAFTYPDIDGEWITPIKTYLEVSDELILNAAVEVANKKLVKWLISEKQNKDVKKIIENAGYSLFSKAAMAGDLGILRFLAAQIPDKFHDLIIANCYEVFSYAASYGHLTILHYLAEQITDLPAMIKSWHYYIFYSTASQGHLSVVHYLATHAYVKLQEMIPEENYYAFTGAAKHGHLPILRYLIENAPDMRIDMISAKNFEAFSNAASNGHLSILRYLVEIAPEKMKAMISANNYLSFRLAAGGGHVSVLQYLMELAPDKQGAMISAEQYVAFQRAASNGHLPVLRYLESKAAPKAFVEMVVAGDYCGYYRRNYSSFKDAAIEGYFDILDFLIERLPDQISNMVVADNYSAFRNSARVGNLQSLRYLVKLAPDKLQNMIDAANFEAFREAAVWGHIPVLDYLIELAPSKVDSMIAANRFYALREAFSLKRNNVVNYLLAYPNAFAYAEAQEQEFNALTIPFIEEQIRELRQTIAAFGNQTIFFSSNKAKHLFYLARALIRRHIHTEDLRLILNIPQVRALAHRPVTFDQPNELLRLSLELEHRAACQCLCTILAVRQEAEFNQYYQNQVGNPSKINLRLIAENPESSMSALSKEEEDCLERLKSHYTLKDSRYSGHILVELRDLLKKRYERSPVQIKKVNGNGVTMLALPFEWERFNRLSLSTQERQMALKGYYSNKNHSAWRFLARPNPWISPSATYIHQDMYGKWSYFEDYIELIAILFLAAKDESIPEVDGFTVSDRITQFIDELSHIGRAHNWDRRDSKGHEYDDLEGDKPSCYTGIKRRLFQSVVAHPLLKPLTMDVIRQEIRELVWNHFQKVINKSNYQILARIWEKCITMDALTEEEKSALSETNISISTQEGWVKSLNIKYGEKFILFKDHFTRMLNLSGEESHFVQFSYLDLNKLIETFQKNDSLGFSLYKPMRMNAENEIPFQFFCLGDNQNRSSVTSNSLFSRCGDG